MMIQRKTIALILCSFLYVLANDSVASSTTDDCAMFHNSTQCNAHIYKVPPGMPQGTTGYKYCKWYSVGPISHCVSGTTNKDATAPTATTAATAN